MNENIEDMFEELTKEQKQAKLADLLNTNVPNLVTDWEKGSYPDEYEMFTKGYKAGYEDCIKGKRYNPKR